jgi:hypothetical protein
MMHKTTTVPPDKLGAAETPLALGDNAAILDQPVANGQALYVRRRYLSFERQGVLARTDLSAILNWATDR